MPHRSRQVWFLFFAMGFSGVVGLVLGEVSLRLLEKVSARRFDGLASIFAESFYYHHRRPGDAHPPAYATHDPLLGWRAGTSASSVAGRVTYNAQGWRSRFNYDRPKKKKKRVALVGDSYTFGSNLTDDTTIAAQLQGFLGNDYEVMSIAAEGYGLDQIAVAATEVAPKLGADYVILGFIADDLPRSCLRFAWGQALKPYYEREADKLVLKGIPVPTPAANAAKHQQLPRRWLDAFQATLTKSRALNVLAGPLLRARQARCVAELNADILAHVKAELSPRIPVLFFHLDGALPKSFEAAAKAKEVTYETLALREPAAAEALGVKPGTSDGYHPDEKRARVIAKLYADFTKVRPTFVKDSQK